MEQCWRRPLLIFAAWTLCTSPSFLSALPKGKRDVNIHLLQKMRGPSSERFSELTEEDPAGVVVTARGKSSILRGWGEELAATLRLPIFVQDTLHTGRHATLKIAFIDQSVLSLAGDTTLSINQYLFHPPKTGASRVVLDKGTLHFMAGKITQLAPENYQVRTAVATIGIRGSSGTVRLGEDEKGSLVLEVLPDPDHVLVVQTRSGQLVELADPKVGIRVFPNGSWLPFAAPEGYFQASFAPLSLFPLFVWREKPHPQPLLPPLSLPLVKERALVWRRSRGKKRSLFQEIIERVGAQWAESTQKLERSSLPPPSTASQWRELEEEKREGSSTRPLLEQLAQEQLKEVEPGSFPSSSRFKVGGGDKEEGSSLPILKRLAKRHLNSQQKERVVGQKWGEEGKEKR